MTSSYLIDSTLQIMARLIATLATVDGELADLSSMHTRFRTYVAKELGPPRNRIALVASAFHASETSVYAWRRDALRRQENRQTDRDYILEIIREEGPRPVRSERLEGLFVQRVANEALDEMAESTAASVRARFDTALWLLRKADLVFSTSSTDPLYFAPELPEGIETRARLLWLEIFERSSITAISRSDLLTVSGLEPDALDLALEWLLHERKVERARSDDPEEPCYRATELYLPFDDSDEDHSLEVAMLDHLKLVMDTIIDRFEQRSVLTGRAGEGVQREREALREAFDAPSGMVSWRFELWSGHPLEQEILSLGERLVEIAHKLSLEARVVDGQREAERVLYVGMHTKPAAPRPDALQGDTHEDD